MKLNINEIAAVAHSVNRAYCLSIGDDSQPTWEEAPGWQRESAMAGVRAHLANPSITPEESHELWSAQKIADGWTFGEEKDVEAKTHPCLVPYSDLPAAQRSKDYIFKAVVESLR